MNNVVLKNHRKCEKTQGYQTCSNRKEKKLFGVKTKYYKAFDRKFVCNRNK